MHLVRFVIYFHFYFLLFLFSSVFFLSNNSAAKTKESLYLNDICFITMCMFLLFFFLHDCGMLFMFHLYLFIYAFDCFYLRWINLMQLSRCYLELFLICLFRLLLVFLLFYFSFLWLMLSHRINAEID